MNTPDFFAAAERLVKCAKDAHDDPGWRNFRDLLCHELHTAFAAGRDAAVPVDIGTRQPRYRP